jgi:pseudouridine-5'-phosphate glycosidase
VVSAGAKSILDLRLTLEYLETYGVPVLGYRTKEFPAFFSRRSGLSVDYQMDNPQSIAHLLHAKWTAGLEGGVLIANPIPQQNEVEFGFIQSAIDQAIQESEQAGIKGKAITPFLLSRIEQLTQGKSLEANIQLVLNNARLAAQVAREFVRG